MLHLDDLRILVEVLDRGSFSAAAVRLGQSKQVVSRRVMALEEQLGTRLLNRTTRRLAATEAGETLARRGRALLADAEAAEQEIAGQSASLRGRLRVSAPVSFGLAHVTGVVPRLLAAHPGLELDIALDDRLVDLVGEGFDMAIRVGALADSSLVARKLGALQSSVCASPAYLHRHGTPDTPADLARHECLLYGHDGVVEWRFRAGNRLRAVPVHGRLRSNNGELLRAAAEAGQGIAVLPNFIAGPSLRAGRLRAILDGHTPEIGVWAVTPQHRQPSAGARAFADGVQACLAAQPGWEDGLAQGG